MTNQSEHQSDEVISAEKTVKDQIPIIDFAGLEGQQRELVGRQVAEACETWGFFQVVNHGLDPELMKEAKKISKEFFYLHEEEKLKIKVGPGQIQGWNHSKLAKAIGDSKLIRADAVEHLYLVQIPDTHENAERYPVNPEAYRPTILEYAKEIQALHFKIMAVLLEQFGLSPELLKRTMRAGEFSMRTNFYALTKGEEVSSVCHAHSDPGFLTLLLADDVPGLEVKKDGLWVPVDPVLGALIVNVGDATEIMSNGKYRSVEHRGLPNRGQERLTIAAFWGPMWTFEVGPLKEILDENHPPLYKTDIFGNYLRDFVTRGLDGKNGLDAYKL